MCSLMHKPTFHYVYSVLIKGGWNSDIVVYHTLIPTLNTTTVESARYIYLKTSK